MNEEDDIDPYRTLIDSSDDSDITITDGLAAAKMFERMWDSDTNESTRAALRTSLLKYCELDTLGMAMLLQGLLLFSNETVKK